MDELSIENMLKSGVHFGHHTKYWNPKNETLYFWRPKQNPHY